MFRSVTSNQILKIIGGRDTLRLRSSEKVLHDWVCIIAERHFDWAFKAVDVSAKSQCSTNGDRKQKLTCYWTHVDRSRASS